VNVIRATFLILLFVTSFGQCWADTLGLFASSEWVCCEPAPKEHHCDGHENEGRDEHDHHEEEKDSSQSPFPPSNCLGCDLVKSGFISSTVDVDTPAPIFTVCILEWYNLEVCIRHVLSCADDAQEPPPPWSLDRDIMTISDIVMTSAVSVRGPNLL